MKVILLIQFYTILGTFCISFISKQSRERRRLLLTVFLVGFALRVLLAVILHYTHPPYGQLFKDDYAYLRTGIHISNLWQDRIWPNYVARAGGGHYGYGIYNGIHFYLLGDSMLYPKLTNCFLGIMVAMLGYYIASSIFDGNVAKLSLFLIAFDPNLIFWSATNLKDTLMMFLITSAIFVHLRLKVRWSVTKLILLVLIALVMQTIRTYLMYAFFLLILLDYLINLGLTRWKNVVILAAMAIILNSIIKLDIAFSRIFSGDIFSDMLFALDNPIDQNSLLASFQRTSVAEYLKYIPLAAFRFLLTPLPWKAEAMYRCLIPGMIIRFFVLPFFGYGIWQVIKSHTKSGFILYGVIIVFILVYSFLLEVSGPRHRTQFTSIILIISAVGLINIKRIILLAPLIWAFVLTGIYIVEIRPPLGIGIVPGGVILLIMLKLIMSEGKPTFPFVMKK